MATAVTEQTARTERAMAAMNNFSQFQAPFPSTGIGESMCRFIHQPDILTSSEM
jgi:hypothetical protein